jgi:hypothetical protein
MEARNMMTEGGRGTALDQSFVNQVSAKWAPLLEGIENPYQRGVMGFLFENQMEHLRSLNEETLSTGVGSFTKYIFPILRRVFPNLIANQIVSVQPMTAPVGGIFTYEYKYGDTKGEITADENLIETFNRYYSSEYVDYEVKVADVGATAEEVWDDSTNPTERLPFKWLPVAALNSSKGFVTTFKFTNQDGGTTSLTDDGSGNIIDSDSTTVGSITYASGAWTLDTSGMDSGDRPGNDEVIYATYYYNSESVANTSAPGAGVTSTSYDTATLGQVAKIPEVNIDITLTTVTAVSRKLKARWSAEAVDDLRAFHGLNAETELVAGIANEIALELDREIIDDLVSNAKYSITYALTSGPSWMPGGGSDPSGNMSELQTIRGLLTAIDSVSAQIHKGSMRAPANFLVVSPEVGAMLAQLTTHGDFMMVNRIEDQVTSPSYGPMNSNFGVQRLGTLMNKYAVYQDPFLTSTKCLVGLKGSSFLDAGYVYAPYIPLQVTPTFLDPDDFTFRKGLRTRYAVKMLREEYYGVVTVSGLPTVSG